jgi:hypothetical protein
MRYATYVHTKYPSLTKDDCVLMLQNIEESMGVFERKNVSLNAAELRVKSMLSAVRMELLQHLDELRND